MKRLALFIIGISTIFGALKTTAQVDVGVSISVAPPALPVYVQPPCPVDGYLWTPGYWGWGPDGYFWVPGVWLRPARVGFLWTPGYWGCEGGHYYWHGGYWGPHVGFYGGVCYGHGYGGTGFYGGRWENGAFRYNTAACNVNTTVIHNTYVDKTVINNTGSHTSFNGAGGLSAKPSEAEESAAKESHVSPTSEQQSHESTAKADKSQLATANGGHPSATAMSSVGGQKFNSEGKAPAKTTSTSKTTSGSKTSKANNTSKANTAHANGSKQQQHTAVQNRNGGQSQHNTMNRAQQHTANGAQQQRNAGAMHAQRNTMQRSGAQPRAGGNKGIQGGRGGGGRKR